MNNELWIIFVIVCVGWAFMGCFAVASIWMTDSERVENASKLQAFFFYLVVLGPTGFLVGGFVRGVVWFLFDLAPNLILPPAKDKK